MGISIRRSRDLGSSALTLPAGIINPFAGVTAPDGWLLCYGQAISRTQYSDLFIALGTTYGSGDGSTTFAIPDMRGRAVAGVDNMGGSDAGRLSIANTLGTTTGAETVTITSGNLPVHTHAIDHTHPNFNTSGGEGAHSHGAHGGTFDSGVPTTYTNRWSTADSFLRDTTTAGAHNHAITLPAFSGTSGNGGFSNTAVDKMQPTIILNYIIKV